MLINCYEGKFVVEECNYDLNGVVFGLKLKNDVVFFFFWNRYVILLICIIFLKYFILNWYGLREGEIFLNNYNFSKFVWF